jgi:hypothetical protein
MWFCAREREKKKKEKWLQMRKIHLSRKISFSALSSNDDELVIADFHRFGDLAVWLPFKFHKARLPKHWICMAQATRRRRNEAFIIIHLSLHSDV